MRGFLVYVVAVASVAALIPWPELWPATLGTIIVGWMLAPDALNSRPDGRKQSRERGV